MGKWERENSDCAHEWENVCVCERERERERAQEQDEKGDVCVSVKSGERNCEWKRSVGEEAAMHSNQWRKCNQKSRPFRMKEKKHMIRRQTGQLILVLFQDKPCDLVRTFQRLHKQWMQTKAWVCVWKREREREIVCACVWERERMKTIFWGIF